MKKGFTILELLVASMLLGMLMTVLTMIFNQSSVSWRIGEASVADLDDASKGISDIRYEADNLYVWNNQSYVLLSIFDESDNLRTRAIGGSGAATVNEIEKITKLNGALNDTTTPGNWNAVTVGNGDASADANTYTINVMSAGPNGTFNDFDDIWSFPDEFD